jgi:hypothetical protein
MSNNSQLPDWQKMIWLFLRGDLPTAEFEAWVYAQDDLKSWLDSEFYLRILDLDYGDPRQVEELRHQLQIYIEEHFTYGCKCHTWKDVQIIPISYGTRPDIFMAQFETIKRHTPWLKLVSCKSCGQAWYLAADTENDDYHLHRLSASSVEAIGQGNWPDDFKGNEIFWPSQEWLADNGFTSLMEWQKKNNI